MPDSPDFRPPLPSLDRETGRVAFPPSADPQHPESLADFLRGCGVRCDVADGALPAVQLAGIPDLNAVEALIRIWHGGSAVLKATIAPPRPKPAGAVGVVRQVDLGRGRAAVEVAGKGYTVIDLLADRNVRVRDELGWEDPGARGMAVYVNRTRGTRLKVYVLAHGVREGDLAGQMAAR